MSLVLLYNLMSEVNEKLSRALRAALTSNAWTSLTTQFYVTFTAYYIGVVWRALKQVMQSHKGKTLQWYFVCHARVNITISTNWYLHMLNSPFNRFNIKKQCYRQCNETVRLKTLIRYLSYKKTKNKACCCKNTTSLSLHYGYFLSSDWIVSALIPTPPVFHGEALDVVEVKLVG